MPYNFDKNVLFLGWLLKNLNKLVYIEVSKYPQHNTVVIIVFFIFHRIYYYYNIFELHIIVKFNIFMFREKQCSNSTGPCLIG